MVSLLLSFYYFYKGVYFMQLTFLPAIDEDETKRNVESAFEEYKMMVLMNPEEIEPKITSTFKLTATSPSNEFNSSTEDVAMKRIELKEKRSKFINRIIRAVNRLNHQERTIIIERYIASDDVYDYEVYQTLGYSESKYYRIKARAFYKLAFMLGIEVYKNGDDAS